MRTNHGLLTVALALSICAVAAATAPAKSKTAKFGKGATVKIGKKEKYGMVAYNLRDPFTFIGDPGLTPTTAATGYRFVALNITIHNRSKRTLKDWYVATALATNGGHTYKQFVGGDSQGQCDLSEYQNVPRGTTATACETFEIPIGFRPRLFIWTIYGKNFKPGAARWKF